MSGLNKWKQKFPKSNFSLNKWFENQLHQFFEIVFGSFHEL